MSDITKTLRNKKLITENAERTFNKKFSPAASELIKTASKQKKSGKGVKYSPELKRFALTLQFYSTRAYNFVRKTFNLGLPNTSTITSWYSKIPAEPGFTEPALQVSVCTRLGRPWF